MYIFIQDLQHLWEILSWPFKNGMLRPMIYGMIFAVVGVFLGWLFGWIDYKIRGLIKKHYESI